MLESSLYLPPSRPLFPRNAHNPQCGAVILKGTLRRPSEVNQNPSGVGCPCSLTCTHALRLHHPTHVYPCVGVMHEPTLLHQTAAGFPASSALNPKKRIMIFENESPALSS